MDKIGLFRRIMIGLGDRLFANRWTLEKDMKRTCKWCLKEYDILTSNAESRTEFCCKDHEVEYLVEKIHKEN